MSEIKKGNLKYIKIDGTNRSLYAGYLPDDTGSDRDASGTELGIDVGDTPCGAMLLYGDEEKCLNIRSLCIAPEYEGTSLRLDTLNKLSTYAAMKGFEKVICRYTDDEDGITEDILGQAGFDEFTKEAVVYRVDAYTLGSLLRDGPYARLSREACIRLMTEGRVTNLRNLPPSLSFGLLPLHPTSDMSFVITRDVPDGEPEISSYVITSRLPDSSIYLSEILNTEEEPDDILGLLYMSFGSVFMEIEPEGDFYVAAVNDKYLRLAEMYFGPVRDLINIQSIKSAVRKL
ncbi:MAG: hypothetical protein K5673_11315 [Lachnospiraceae bacterium]|nr:hypothetical protein [Lachnospiraceae bacterium]